MKTFLMVQTSADEAVKDIKRCTSIAKLRRELIHEKKHMHRTTIIRAIEQRIKKLKCA